MKLAEKEPEAKEVLYPSSCGPKQEYPWGLQVRLGEDELKKLGIELPAVGEELMLHAKVKVCTVSSHETDAGVNRHLELQITDMAVGKE